MSELPSPIVGGYPPSDHGAPWPTRSFERAAAPQGVSIRDAMDEIMDPNGDTATTYAALVIHQGRIVGEGYGGTLPSLVHEPTQVDAATPLLSWSMAKSVLSIVVGTLVAEGALDLDHPVEVAEWSAPGDPRQAITLRSLLEMRDGLDFVEDYVDDRASDVIEMLFGSGKDDVAHFAADRPLAAEPGSRFNYSSGTTNIISRIVTNLVGGRDEMQALLRTRLFDPLSMASATPTFDAAGTFVASSYLHATAEDYGRFGLMLCRGGVAGDTRVVPESWIDWVRHARSSEEGEPFFHSAHFWVHGDDLGSFAAHGYEGQRIVVVPPLDLVLVRLGKTPIERSVHLDRWERGVIDQFRSSR